MGNAPVMTRRATLSLKVEVRCLAEDPRQGEGFLRARAVQRARDGSPPLSLSVIEVERRTEPVYQ